jgi:hypothetical protein
VPQGMVCPVPDQFTLDAWYANPMSEEQAQSCLQQLDPASGDYRQNTDQQIIIKMISHFWLHRTDVDQLDGWLKQMPDKIEDQNKALLTMIYGQLLMSCKKTGALKYLSRGFLQAAHYFQPQDYFVVMKRNELLSFLKLSDAGSPPATLQELENEAQVIKRLTKNKNKQYKNSQFDTLG